MPNKHVPLYQAFLLRAWCETQQGEWRVMVQAAGSDKRELFSDLLAAFAWLEAELDARAPAPPSPPPSEPEG